MPCGAFKRALMTAYTSPFHVVILARGGVVGSPPVGSPSGLLGDISWYLNDYGPPWISLDLNLKMRSHPRKIAGSSGVLPATTEQKASAPSLSSPSGTCASRGGIVVSSLVSSVSQALLAGSAYIGLV